MSKLLYESKGGPISKLIADVVGIMLAVVGAVFMFCISGAKSSRISIGGGYFGGGYLLEPSARTAMIIIGILFLLGAFYFLCGILGLFSCFVKVYDDHIEARPYTVFLKKGIVQLTYGQISSIEQNGSLIILVAGGKKMRLLAKQDPSKAAELIRQRLPK
ncbi:MAG: hypothetical protein PUC32_06785 [Oscillospiraceae bacterium]|nr:hypothetical protein [Oscillospiraceae bacterium]